MCYASVPLFFLWGNHTYHTGFFTEETGNPPFQINQPGFNGKLLRYGLPMSRLGSDFEGQQHSCRGAGDGGGQNGLKSGWVVGGVLHLYVNKSIKNNK